MFAQCPPNNQSHGGVNGESILGIAIAIGRATKPWVAWELQAGLAPSPSGASIWRGSFSATRGARRVNLGGAK